MVPDCAACRHNAEPDCGDPIPHSHCQCGGPLYHWSTVCNRCAKTVRRHVITSVEDLEALKLEDIPVATACVVGDSHVAWGEFNV